MEKSNERAAGHLHQLVEQWAVRETSLESRLPPRNGFPPFQ